jgi:MFS superfamily sulfate permease-like transporter
VLLGAWLAGTSSTSVSARRALAPYLARADVAYGIAAALFLLLLWWQPTVQTSRVPLMLAAAAILVLAVELLRRQTGREVPEPGEIDLAGAWRRRRGGRAKT